MDSDRFDELSRVLGSGTSRRGVLGLLVAAAGLGLGEVRAKVTPHRKGKGKGKGNGKGKHPPHHGGKVDTHAKPACSKAGAACSATKPCCSGLRCASGTCV